MSKQWRGQITAVIAWIWLHQFCSSPFIPHSFTDNMPHETSPLLSSSSRRNEIVSDGPRADAEDGLDSKAPSKSETYWSFLIPMAVGIFLAAMDQTMVVTVYASIGSELEQLHRTSWISTAYMLTVTSFQPIYGKLSDIFGRKNCLLFAYAIFAFGSLCCGLSRNMTGLILSRAFTGVGGGGITTIASIVLSDVVPLRSRGTWQGYLNIIYTTGSIAGAPLGGLLVDNIGWRWAFLIQTPITLVAMLLVATHLGLGDLDRDASGLSTKLKRVDIFGSITLVIAIFSLLMIFDHGGNVSWTDMVSLFSQIGFALAFLVFIAVEKWVAVEPIAPGSMVFNRSLIGAYLSNFFGVAVMMTAFFYIPLYLQAVQEMSASKTSLWLVFTVLAGLSGSLGGGFIMQITGKFYGITVVAYAVLATGTVLLFLSIGVVGHSTLGVALGLVLVSLGNGAGTTTALIALISNSGKDNQAIVTAVSYLFRSLGSVIAVSFGNTVEQQALRWNLEYSLKGENVEEIIQHARESLDYIYTLDPGKQGLVRAAYGDAIRAVLIFGVAAASLSFLSSIFIKGKVLVQ
ncbi:major facilitator superfamily domain-containing protein [Collybia nuda]|uniref:Major facilitator superfamily domain-containing protein n=1 Tax=Collybia nuda TaxID=64659 RepID=A0A9P5XSZ5_9AGAR|nr:major facilitator superfamily domain-containing protein [Collybia nuda]